MIQEFQERKLNPAAAKPTTETSSVDVNMSSNPNISAGGMDDYRPMQRPRDREKDRGRGGDRKRSRSPSGASGGRYNNSR